MKKIVLSCLGLIAIVSVALWWRGPAAASPAAALVPAPLHESLDGVQVRLTAGEVPLTEGLEIPAGEPLSF